MMDDSDGIALSLYDLADVNRCGFSLESKNLPMPAGIPSRQAQELALHGGGDYELIFTLPPSKHPVEGLTYRVIGSVTVEKSITIDGRPIPKRGFQHTWE